MKNNFGITVEQGSKSVSDECFKIAQVYSLQLKEGNPQDGFLLGTETRERYNRIFTEGKSRVAIDKATSRIAGFIFGYQHDKELFSEQFDPEKKSKLDNGTIFSEPLFYIDKIVVSKEYKGQSIGEKLYDSMLKEIKSRVCAFIIEKPIKNNLSIQLHNRLRFRRHSELEISTMERVYTCGFYVREVDP